MRPLRDPTLSPKGSSPVGGRPSQDAIHSEPLQDPKGVPKGALWMGTGVARCDPFGAQKGLTIYPKCGTLARKAVAIATPSGPLSGPNIDPKGIPPEGEAAPGCNPSGTQH